MASQYETDGWRHWLTVGWRLVFANRGTFTRWSVIACRRFRIRDRRSLHSKKRGRHRQVFRHYWTAVLLVGIFGGMLIRDKMPMKALRRRSVAPKTESLPSCRHLCFCRGAGIILHIGLELSSVHGQGRLAMIDWTNSSYETTKTTERCSHLSYAFFDRVC